MLVSESCSTIFGKKHNAFGEWKKYIIHSLLHFPSSKFWQFLTTSSRQSSVNRIQVFSFFSAQDRKRKRNESCSLQWMMTCCAAVRNFKSLSPQKSFVRNNYSVVIEPSWRQRNPPVS